MVHQLQNTVDGIELWYDSDIMTAEMTVATKNVYPTMKLNEGLYFKTPMTFILKRDTRADFNYKSPDSDAYLVGGLYTYTINSVNYNYGMRELNVGRDSNTKRVEIVVDTNNIGNLSELQPEPVEIKVPDYSGENEYVNLIDSGKVTLKINGEILTTTNNVTVNKYDNFDIEIINNQLNQQFDYENIRFTKTKMDGSTGNFVTIDFTPDVKTPDKMVYHVNSLTWNRYINDGNLKLFSPNALPYLAFIAREVEPVEDYPFLNIYKVDDDSLTTLAKEVNERRYKKDIGSDGSIIKDYDVSGNIIDLVRIPYAIQTEPDLEYINLNNEAMQSQGNQVLNYIQEINLGKIHCYHDTLVNIGYKNIEFNLFVPNFKPISLDVSKVIDRTIEMKLNLDLTTGQGTLNILIDGIVFHVEQEKISKDIPFKTDNNRISLEDNVLNTKYLNPYLEITVLNPDNTINTQELKQRKINKSSLLYAKSDNIILNSKATYNEQLEIEMLLRKGVYING